MALRRIPSLFNPSAATDYIGHTGELFYDTDNGALRLSDGETTGGAPVSFGGGDSGIQVDDGDVLISAFGSSNFPEDVSPAPGPQDWQWRFTASGLFEQGGAYVANTLDGIVEIDLTAQITKMPSGTSYQLPDGVEGQVLYLVAKTGATGCQVTVAHARSSSSGTISETDNLTWTPFANSSACKTLVFTDGRWNLS